MIRRYAHIFKAHIIYFFALLILIITASVTNGTIATIFSSIAGALMIYIVARIIIWLMKTETERTDTY